VHYKEINSNKGRKITKGKKYMFEELSQPNLKEINKVIKDMEGMEKYHAEELRNIRITLEGLYLKKKIIEKEEIKKTNI